MQRLLPILWILSLVIFGTMTALFSPVQRKMASSVYASSQLIFEAISLPFSKAKLREERIQELESALSWGEYHRAQALLEKRREGDTAAAELVIPPLGFDLEPATVFYVNKSASHTRLIAERPSTEVELLGLQILSPTGTLIGYIDAVSLSAIRIQLYIGSGEELLVEESTSGSSFLAIGDRPFGYSSGYLLPDDRIAEGAIVYTSGKQHGIPAGLPIGTMISVEASPSEPFSSAVIEPFGDPLGLVTLLVLIPKQDL
jgi:hypothetical protein